MLAKWSMNRGQALEMIKTPEKLDIDGPKPLILTCSFNVLGIFLQLFYELFIGTDTNTIYNVLPRTSVFDRENSYHWENSPGNLKRCALFHPVLPPHGLIYRSKEGSGKAGSRYEHVEGDLIFPSAFVSHP